MKIKRYLDKDMRNVLRRVREDQGPDAVILSNRRIDEGIEVIAAVDYDEALVRHAIGAPAKEEAVISSDVLAGLAEDDAPEAPAAEVLSANLVQGPAEPGPEAASPAAADPAPESDKQSNKPTNDRREDRQGNRTNDLPNDRPTHSPAFDAGIESRGSEDQQMLLDGVREEMAVMRGMIASQLSGMSWQATTERDPMRAQILRNFARLGLSPDTAQMLLNRLGPIDDLKRLWQEPLMELARSIPVAHNTLLEEGGVYALLGPTGVGKTTTIAKLAARFAMRHGADQIALVSADAYRIGAREHLTAFANIIGAKVYSASNSAELRDTLTRLGNYRLVLIDTEGRSQRDRDLANRLAAWGDHANRVRYYLTLSAATQEAALEEIVRSFQQVPLEGAVVTKIDEAAQLGCVLSTLIRHDLPAAWLSDGQRIPEDMHSATRKRMWLVNQAVDCLEAAGPEIGDAALAEFNSKMSVANG